jgi:gluconate 2-dehydrogenase gamma chain
LHAFLRITVEVDWRMNDIDDLNTLYSRRTMMGATLGLAGVVALCGLATTRAAAIAAQNDPTLRYFSKHEAATIDALAAQIIPTDDTPGAREMGVVSFIDQALMGFLSPLASSFRKRLADFEADCLAGQDGQQEFVALTSDAQIEWLRLVAHTPFFESLQQLTVLGALSMPQYGGNRNGLGWKLIGFQDLHAFTPPFGHYDRDYPGFSPRASA